MLIHLTCGSHNSYSTSGQFKKWHPVTINFTGPFATETDNDPNPFLDDRLVVLFKSQDGQPYTVPGFFDGDGRGNGKGNTWRVRFTPDATGQWTFAASFHTGKNIAISLNPQEGQPTAFDATKGEFTIIEHEKGYFPVNNPELHRKQKLWPVYFSGGMLESILADLLNTDSFKTPTLVWLWGYTWYARQFMEENLPYCEMAPADQLVTGVATLTVGQGNDQQPFHLEAQVFARTGEIYAIYFPNATTTGSIDLNDVPGEFEQKWYDPRTGTFAGTTRKVIAGRKIKIGYPPNSPAGYWVVLLTK